MRRRVLATMNIIHLTSFILACFRIDEPQRWDKCGMYMLNGMGMEIKMIVLYRFVGTYLFVTCLIKIMLWHSIVHSDIIFFVVIFQN